MEKNKVSTFVKKYKGVLITGTIAAGLVAGSYFFGKRAAYAEIIKKIENEIGKRRSMPGVTIKDQLTLGDLGKLGEKCMEFDNSLTESTKVISMGSIEFE